MSLESELEKMNNHLDRIATAQGSIAALLLLDAGIEIPEDPEPVQQSPVALAPSRDEIKNLLRERGVKFQAAARTATLEKLLEDSADTPAVRIRRRRAEPTIVPPPVIPDPVVETPTKAATRDALVSLSASLGKDTALAVLKKFGKADKLSDVAEENYAAIIEACNAGKD